MRFGITCVRKEDGDIGDMETSSNSTLVMKKDYRKCQKNIRKELKRKRGISILNLRFLTDPSVMISQFLE